MEYSILRIYEDDICSVLDRLYKESAGYPSSNNNHPWFSVASFLVHEWFTRETPTPRWRNDERVREGRRRGGHREEKSLLQRWNGTRDRGGHIYNMNRNWWERGLYNIWKDSIWGRSSLLWGQKILALPQKVHQP